MAKASNHSCTSPVKPKRVHGEVLRFFREVVIPHRGKECLIWPYSADSRGYPQVGFGGKNFRAHRLACEEMNGPPPTRSHDAAHYCGKRLCVNPAHMRWATRRENMHDTVKHGTAARGTRCGSAKLDEAAVRAIRAMRGKASQSEIAKMFGVSNITVCNIQLRSSWAWLD